LALLN